MPELSKWCSLTEDQRQWVIDNYATTRKQDIAAKFGVSEYLVKKWGRDQGLKTPKSRYMIQKGQVLISTLSEEKQREVNARKGAAHRALRKKEQARVYLGLAQLTRLRIVSLPKNKIYLRHTLKTKGYIPDQKYYSRVYYTESTRRSKICEKHAAKYDIKILPLPNNINANGTNS